MVMMVEAKGLADITSLASNPPPQPGVSSTDQTLPLTLYIVRVPGSRDVFLTPWKPRDRVVNAQDVHSSLYFLHVESLEDDLVPEDEPEAQDDAALSLLPSQTGIESVRRKPLPTPPTSPREDDARSTPSPREHWGNWPSIPARKPVAVATNGRYDGTQREGRPDLPPRRKPVSSPDLAQPASSPSSPRDSWSSIPARKPVLPRRSPNRDSMASLSPTLPPAPRDNSPASHGNEESGQKFTLIRRDPSTGEQWNVAKIRDPPVDEVCSSPNIETKAFVKKRKNSGAPIYLDIDNLAYAPFSRPEDHGFRRRMWMDGSRHADHTYSTQHVTTLPSSDRRSKGYAFLDVWSQKCEFSTSSTGNALRCRREASTPHGAVSTTTRTDISELRFNLPTIHLHAKVNLQSPTHDAPPKRFSYFSTHADAALGPTNTEGGGDYSLGRERAGGGFGGRETKLGKLIVHPAGQEMLDLVVAANMGLWWRAYERTSAR